MKRLTVYQTSITSEIEGKYFLQLEREIRANHYGLRVLFFGTKCKVETRTFNVPKKAAKDGAFLVEWTMRKVAQYEQEIDKRRKALFHLN